jgi:hypothetical protein
MLKKSAVTSLVVICVTIVISLWLVRDSLCDVSYESGGDDFESNACLRIKIVAEQVAA